MTQELRAIMSMHINLINVWNLLTTTTLTTEKFKSVLIFRETEKLKMTI